VSDLDRWLTVATVVRPRGNRGEVIARVLAPDFELAGSSVLLIGPQGQPFQAEPVRIERAWHHKGHTVVKFAGVDSISEADRIRGFAVRVPRSLLKLGDGEFWMEQLVGCRLVDSITGGDLGVIEDWQETGGPLLLVVRDHNGAELLVPFARSICVGIDVAAKKILAQLPDGLKELNRR
jgi:16S rRNA processing protein RimM